MATKVTTPELIDLPNNQLATVNTDGVVLPKGTTATRPGSAVDGEFRYNTTTKKVEYYDGSAWFTLDSVVSAGQGSNFFNTVIYTGTNTTQSISTLDFEPGMVWFKNRAGTNSHAIVDSVRTRSKYLYPDDNFAENTSAASNDMTSFDSNGFSLGVVSQAGSTNTTTGGTDNLVAWSWKAGGAAVTNNTGTQSTQVSANVGAGFSIVSLTHPSINVFTYGHSLSAVPELIILKRTDATDDWYVYTAETGNTARMQLNDDAAVFNSTGVWGSTTPTDEVFTIYNQTAGDYIAYCWTSIAGYSKIGSYTGSGLATGPLVETGFKPAWIMIKCTDYPSGTNWTIFDNKRPGYYLYADTTSAEGNAASLQINFTSTGFNTVGVDGTHSASGYKYIYMAFSE